MMVAHSRPLLEMLLQLLIFCFPALGFSSDRYFYQDIFNSNGNGEIHFKGVKLRVDSSQPSVYALRGSKTILSCQYWYEPELTSPRKVRVKWSWLPAVGGHETDVLVAIGPNSRSFGDFKGRVHLPQYSPGDASLVMTELQLNDTGRYRCEVIDGVEDESATVDLELRGAVFPYQPRHGRYNMTYHEAQQVCVEQDSTLATFEQLFQAWEEGLNWCNAGWLADGTVQYPITQPRMPCGGPGLGPGVRSYGRRHRQLHRYDVFCISSSLQGKVFYLQRTHKLNFTEAQQACFDEGAQIAKVGQLYAAWRFMGLDRCDAGWLADGSVRYPITKPRRNCGPMEAGVRSFGFAPPHQRHGVYCYSAVVVFPYQPRRGRYNLTYHEAQQVCVEQDSTLATYEQLFQAWKEGLNWCNAGWLADGTVQYPITRPRNPCGGPGLGPGIRSYGTRHRQLERYDVFCSSSPIRGKVFYLQPAHKLNLTEAREACFDEGAQIAKVGQLYVAWRFMGLDRCDPGWLADGSVRYPITKPRRNCGPMEAGVHSFGFAPPHQKHGVYCYTEGMQ
ncbi:hyaluronan and proteoglycan link protein 3 [Esox lucius]|uniref:Hyaluronan and proteoglycan link protein 3 n=1 Tax=Esox lucius TaxID=8010 RepID=A0A3P8ZFM7_ESOLU|nr:hyaluronan and proteoglycan link protein 3 [Esox lucius]